MKTSALLAALMTFAVAGAHAQTIERVKLSDNDLGCKQIYAEIGQMDGVIARANQPVAVATQPPAGGDAAAGAAIGAGVAGAVAQTALARSGGFGGFGGFGGGLGGGIGGMFSGIAQQAMASQAQQQQATAQAAAQQAQLQAQQNVQQGQQAQGRKEHLTGLFLAKGCKMSEVQ